MSSTIFYRFKSQRNTSRILFDGTGLTVFDLKREIIQENKLGDGTDFQLKIYNPDTEEYDDDAFVIPRSTSVIVKRSPAIKSFSVHSRLKGNVGAAALGNATRYVTGRPRVLQKRQHTATTTANVSGTTEEERIASMFATQENQWEQTQEEMSAATPVFSSHRRIRILHKKTKAHRHQVICAIVVGVETTGLKIVQLTAIQILKEKESEEPQVFQRSF